MASFTAELQNSPWYTRTPLVATNPLQKRPGNREHSHRLETGRRRRDPGDLTPRTEIAVARVVPRVGQKGFALPWLHCRRCGATAQYDPGAVLDAYRDLTPLSRTYPARLRRDPG